MRILRLRGGRGVAPVAVDMQHGEPKMRHIGMGPRKLKWLTKKHLAKGEPIVLSGTRLDFARLRFRLIEAERITGKAATGVERDNAKLFARFRAAARRRALKAARAIEETMIISP